MNIGIPQDTQAVPVNALYAARHVGFLSRGMPICIDMTGGQKRLLFQQSPSLNTSFRLVTHPCLTEK
jgi:hypothetical protein